MLKEIFEVYWEKLFILLSLIGIGMKMIFSFVLKRKEINHSIFQKNKMETLIRFYNAYAEMKNVWRDIPAYPMFKNELSTDELDNRIQPKYNKLEACIIELQPYFKPNQYLDFKNILKNVTLLKSNLLKLYFEEVDLSTTLKVNEFNSDIDLSEEANSKILEKINRNIYKSY